MLSRRNLSHLSRRCSPNSCLINRLEPLCLLFPTPVLCFQRLAASFPKTPGWGVPRFPFQLPTAHCSRLTTRSPLTTFRMNTCKSVSKQSALTIFRMNTYAKQGGGGWGAEDRILLLGASSAQPPESSRVAQCAALAVEEAPAAEAGKRGGACLRPRPCAQWTLCVHRGRCFLSPATHTEPPAGVLAGLQVAAMPTRNFCSG